MVPCSTPIKLPYMVRCPVMVNRLSASFAKGPESARGKNKCSYSSRRLQITRLPYKKFVRSQNDQCIRVLYTGTYHPHRGSLKTHGGLQGRGNLHQLNKWQEKINSQLF